MARVPKKRDAAGRGRAPVPKARSVIIKSHSHRQNASHNTTTVNKATPAMAIHTMTKLSENQAKKGGVFGCRHPARRRGVGGAKRPGGQRPGARRTAPRLRPSR